MIKQEQLDRLSHVEDFISFLEEIRSRREATISQLHDRPDFAVQQIAGRILEADDILKMGGWETIEARRRG